MKAIYLDNNSTTIMDPSVVQEIADCMAAGFANPASQHQLGQLARRKLELIRSDTAKHLGAIHQGLQSDSLVFTSGGTESNNLAIRGLAFTPEGKIPEIRRVIVSSIEHPSVLAAAESLIPLGFEIEKVRVSSLGVTDLNHLADLLEKPARLVSVMTVNHETGTVQPVEKIAELCRQHGVIFHSDAVQAVGKIPVSFSSMGADAISFTAHKLHGPKNIGGLILKHGIRVFPHFFGGFQQLGLRPGTEDVCLASGQLTALKNFDDSIDERTRQVAALKKRLEESLCEHCEVTINGLESIRVPHTCNISFVGVNRQEFLMAADMNGLAVSTGSACASGSSDPSPVLTAMGLNDDVINGAIRISLSAQTTASEIDLATERIIKIANNLRR